VKVSRRSFLTGISAFGGGSILSEHSLHALTRGGKQNILFSPKTGTTYYFSTSGSDSNRGTSPGSPFLSITKANSLVLKAGDRILFQGGQTFSGGLSFQPSNYLAIALPSTKYPVTIGSYGTGRATISSTSVVGCSIYDIGFMVVRDLIFIGSGGTANVNQGVSLYNDLPVQMQDVLLYNLDISNFDSAGIMIGGGFGTPINVGYSNVTASNCTVHGNYDGFITYTNTAPCTFNLLITGSKFYSNAGKAAASSASGNGIGLGGVNGAVVQYCEAYSNGANNTLTNGPVGIWAYGSTNVLFQFCESHNNLSNGGDGGGFDLDGGVTNSIIQYCYSHDNFGYGYLIYAYSGTNNAGNTVRYCISQNNNNGSSLDGEVFIANAGTTFSGLNIYNNTFYPASGKSCISYGTGTITSANFYNNIFYAQTGAYMINTHTFNQSTSTYAGNDYYGGGQIAWNGTTYSTMAAWQTATGQEKIGGSNVGLTSNPQLTNPGGGGTTNGYNPSALTAYELVHGSPMIGAGINLSTQFSINPGVLDYYSDTIPNGGAGTGFNVGADGANR
jgi:hypothetical protein